MADQIVNPESAAQLKPRNSEPTHLGGNSWTDLGGRSWDGPQTPDAYKIDAAKAISGKDTSIPASVPAEPSHVANVDGGFVREEDDKDDDKEIEFEFGDKNEASDVDDLDKALDEADDLPASKIDVKAEEAEDDDKDDVNEEADEEADEKDDKEDDSDDDKPAFLKKEEASDDNEDEDEAASEKKDVKEEAEDDDEDEKKEKEGVDESLKISIKIPNLSLFESAGFSSKQQKQVAAVFESAIKTTTRQVGKQIYEFYKKKHTQKLAEANAKLEARLNTYLEVVVEEWFKTNQVEVRKSLRADLAENFLNGLQKLFKEHYIDVPASKVDVVSTLTSQVEDLKRQVNEQTAQKMKLRRLAESANKMRIVAQFARNLSEAQAAKLEKLAEDTEYTNAKDFRGRLAMLKESYFGTSQSSEVKRLPEEDVQVVKESNGAKSEVDVVADAISRQVKSDW